MSEQNDLSLSELMKKAKTMQDKMKSMHDKLSGVNVVGSSDNKLVQIKMSGKYEVTGTIISDNILTGKKENLQNAVTESINDAIKQIAVICNKLLI